MSAATRLVPGVVSEPARETSCETADEALRRCLEPRFPGIAAIRCDRSSAATSYGSEILTLELAGRETKRVFLKDFGRSRLPKDDVPARRERELTVYRELLDPKALGTATFYGALWDEARNRFWLFLELVDGRELRSCGFEDWVRAAGWLGHMQGQLARDAEWLGRCEVLAPHDARFFRRKARLALQAASSFSPLLARRVRRIIRDCRRLVPLMTSQPRTLVHGSYRPQNILVSAPAARPRVTPVDWELAAFGSPLYDFAFLADGFEPPELDALWDAYRRGARRWDLSVPAWEEASRVVRCFRLVKTLKSLGDAVSLKFEEATVRKLVASGEAIAGGL